MEANGENAKKNPEYILTELTSLEELSFPTSSTRRIKYTCISVSPRFLIVGTCSGTVYVFSRYASKNRAKLAPLPVSVFTTRDGSVFRVAISPSESHVAVGSESGRVSVASLQSPAPNASPAPSLIYTVPGDIRRPDRVSCLCWSAKGEPLLYAGHATGKVVQHRISARSVFRTSCDSVCQVDGPIVQISASDGYLLVSGGSNTYIISLSNKYPIQVGSKVRNDHMGACFSGPSSDEAVIFASRPNGRIWEANLAGTVFKTHQFRQLASIPLCPPISFNTPFDPGPSIDIDELKHKVAFGNLDIIETDGQRFLVSLYQDNCIIADVESESPNIELVTPISTVLDYTWCGCDLFVLLTGDGGLRKYTLFRRSKAVEKLVFKKAFIQAAQLILQVPEAIAADDIHTVFDGLHQMAKSREGEFLINSLKRFVDTSHIIKLQAASLPVTPVGRRRIPNSLTTPVSRQKPSTSHGRLSSERLSSGIHRVLAEKKLEKSGYDDDFIFKVASSVKNSICAKKERSKSSSPAPESKRKPTALSSRRTPSDEDCARREVTPDIIKKAKMLLDTRGSAVPEIDSLRILLGLDVNTFPESVDFNPTITLANAPRSLAELATSVPIEFSEILQLEAASPLSQRPSPDAGPALCAGARVVKTVRPTAARPMSRVVHVRTENVHSADDRSVRFDVTTTSLLADGSTRSEKPAPVPSTPAKSEEQKAHFCSACSLHRSWVAVALLIPYIGNVSVTNSSSDIAVPTSAEGWIALLHHRLLGTPLNVRSIPSPCSRCINAFSRLKEALENMPVRFNDSPSRLDTNLIRRIAFSISDEHIANFLIGHYVEVPLKQERIPNVVKQLPSPSALFALDSSPRQSTPNLLPAAITAAHEQKQNVFLADVDNAVILVMCACCIGVEAFYDIIQSPSETQLLAAITSEQLALLARFQYLLALIRVYGPKIPMTVIKDILNEYSLCSFVNLESQKEPENKRTPPNSSTRTVSSKPVVLKSWIYDTNRNCPMCTLPLRTVVGGVNAGIVSYHCGHTFHTMCVCKKTAQPLQAQASSSKQPPSSSSTEKLCPPAACIACRIRMRARKSASVAARR